MSGGKGMTREEATRWLKEMKDTIELYNDLSKSYTFDKYPQAIDMAISALSAEPKTIANNCDLISRADAIEAVRKELVCDGRHETHDKTCRFIADVLLSALPSAERVGEWKPIEIKGYPYVTCDQCGMLADMVDYDGKLVMSMANANETYANYCPNCGARMKGGTK